MKSLIKYSSTKSRLFFYTLHPKRFDYLTEKRKHVLIELGILQLKDAGYERVGVVLQLGMRGAEERQTVKSSGSANRCVACESHD